MDELARGMRILFASTHSYPPQRVGGIESNTHELCSRLQAEGDDVAVLARLAPDGVLALVNRIRRKLPFGPQFPADRTMGYPVYRGWSPVQGVGELGRRFAPEVVVVQGSAQVPLARSFLASGARTALYLHDVEFDRLGGDVPSDPELLFLANSEFTKERARRDLGIDAHVIRPLVRPDAYRTDSGPGDKVVFVNPHPRKGVDKAFALARSRPDIPFLFVESWSLRPARKREYVERAAQIPNIEWSEPVDEMRDVYRQARLLLVPSSWDEAWGRVVTEAQVSGIPVLASDRGGLPESVGDGGLLVDPARPISEWETALSRMWDDEHLYASLSEAATRHSTRPDIQPESIVDQFRELMAKHARRA